MKRKIPTISEKEKRFVLFFLNVYERYKNNKVVEMFNCVYGQRYFTTKELSVMFFYDERVIYKKKKDLLKLINIIKEEIKNIKD